MIRSRGHDFDLSDARHQGHQGSRCFLSGRFRCNTSLVHRRDHAVAGFEIHGAPFFLAEEAPDYGTRAPSSAGFTTVRIELVVDDPIAVHRKAIAAGAKEHSPVREHTHETFGPRPIRRMLQGAVLDRFGHIWLIGKFLD